MESLSPLEVTTFYSLLSDWRSSRLIEGRKLVNEYMPAASPELKKVGSAFLTGLRSLTLEHSVTLDS